MVNNGFLSVLFVWSKGTRQGCPMRPLLYVIVAEILAVAVRREPRIRGISLPGGGSEKLVSYADDNTALVSDVKSATSLVEVIKKYEAASGAKLNTDKTEGLWLGSFRGRDDNPG